MLHRLLPLLMFSLVMMMMLVVAVNAANNGTSDASVAYAFATVVPTAGAGDDDAGGGAALAPPAVIQTRDADKSIVEMLETVPEMSTFLAALKRASLLDELIGNTGPFTLIVPWNQAFEMTMTTTTSTTSSTSTLTTALLDPNEERDLLNKILWWPEWRLHLKDLLLHHIYLGSLSIETAMIMTTTTTSSGNSSSSSGSNSSNAANGSTGAVNTAALLSMANGEAVTIEATGQQDRIFFNNEPLNIIAYYELSNGYVYTTDTIMFPSFVRNTIETVVAKSSPSSSSTTLVNLNSLSNPTTTTTTYSTKILMELLLIAGLESELNRPNAVYTLFAPTDAAFAGAVDPDTLSSWRSSTSTSSSSNLEQQEELKKLLKYHIVPGVYASTSFFTQDDNNNNNSPAVELVTMSNQPLIIRKSLASVNNGRTMLRINDSDILVTMTSPDRLAKNGIVHVISQVLIPPQTTTTTTSSSSSSSPTVPTSDTPETSSSDTNSESTTTTTSSNPNTIISTTNTTATTTTTLANILLDTPELQVLGEAFFDIGLVGHDSSSSSILGGRYYQGEDADAVLPSSTSSYTVFAPENQAFANNGLVNLYFDDRHGYALHLKELFAFHIAPGIILAADLRATNTDSTIQMINHQYLTVQVHEQDDEMITLRPAMNDVATILTPNVMATNGVVHMIDSMLLPPFALQTLWSWCSLTTPMFTTFIEAAEMQDVLKTKSSLTVFAPSDEAIDKLGAGTVAFLLSADGKSSLIDLVSYHIVDSLHPSTLIRQQQQEQQLQQVSVPTMLMGRHLDIFVKANENGSGAAGDDDEGIILVNAGMAQVMSADNLVSNGIIHVIDTVLKIPTTSSAVGTSTSTTTTGPSYYYRGEQAISDILGNQELSSALAVAPAVTRILFLLFATAAAADSWW